MDSPIEQTFQERDSQISNYGPDVKENPDYNSKESNVMNSILPATPMKSNVQDPLELAKIIIGLVRNTKSKDKLLKVCQEQWTALYDQVDNLADNIDGADDLTNQSRDKVYDIAWTTLSEVSKLKNNTNNERKKLFQESQRLISKSVPQMIDIHDKGDHNPDAYEYAIQQLVTQITTLSSMKQQEEVKASGSSVAQSNADAAERVAKHQATPQKGGAFSLQMETPPKSVQASLLGEVEPRLNRRSMESRSRSPTPTPEGVKYDLGTIQRGKKQDQE